MCELEIELNLNEESYRTIKNVIGVSGRVNQMVEAPIKSSEEGTV